jgi:acylphosphatase
MAVTRTVQRRVHIFVSGRVQGVGYRASALEKARSLGLGGWVRNLADGSVEICAEGENLSMVAFIAWCGRGPPFARVDELKVIDETHKGDFTGFDVRRDGPFP